MLKYVQVRWLHVNPHSNRSVHSPGLRVCMCICAPYQVIPVVYTKNGVSSDPGKTIKDWDELKLITVTKAAHTLAYLIGQCQPIWSVQTKSLKYLPVCGVLQIKSGTSDRSFWSSIKFMLEFLTRHQILSLSVWPVAGEMWQILDQQIRVYKCYWHFFVIESQFLQIICIATSIYL